MAQKVVVTLFDDIDGSEAAETIAFGLDGKSYEIDLNEVNARKLRKALAPYVEAGRKRSRSGKAYKQTEVAPDPAAVRAGGDRPAVSDFAGLIPSSTGRFSGSEGGP